MAIESPSEVKTCTDCGTTKSIREFGKSKGGKGGLRSICRPCDSVRKIAWAKANPEKKRASWQKWYLTHHKSDSRERKQDARTEALSRGVKVCARCPAEKSIVEFGKDRRQRDGLNKYCRECHKAIGAQWCLDNPGRVQEAQQRYYVKHADQRLAARNRWARDLRAIDQMFRRLSVFRAEFARVFKSKRGGQKLFTMLGYTRAELRAHFEQRFDPNMSWDNYGDIWQIDHIRPIASFMFQGEADIVTCWALSNLRPLLEPDNQAKWSYWNDSRWYRGKSAPQSTPAKRSSQST